MPKVLPAKESDYKQPGSTFFPFALLSNGHPGALAFKTLDIIRKHDGPPLFKILSLPLPEPTSGSSQNGEQRDFEEQVVVQSFSPQQRGIA